MSNQPEYYIHWKSGHREGWTSISFTEKEAEAIIKSRKEADPEIVIELIPATESRMISELVFFVEGHPRPKQSFKVGRSGGRVVGFTPARVKSWQTDVAYTAQLHMRAFGLVEPVADNLTVRLAFFLPDARRQDSDNLSKAVLDGLNGVVWEDDKQVIDLSIVKYICRDRQGVLVRVEPSPRRLEITLDEMNLFTSFMVPELIGARA